MVAASVPAEEAGADGVHAARGLTQAEARRRLERDGPNEVPEPRTHVLARFAAKFWSTSAWMLELIAFLSFLLHKVADAWIAVALLVINAIICAIQEQRASWQTLAVSLYAAVACLVVDDPIKVLMLRRWVPTSRAKSSRAIASKSRWPRAESNHRHKDFQLRKECTLDFAVARQSSLDQVLR